MLFWANSIEGISVDGVQSCQATKTVSKMRFQDKTAERLFNRLPAAPFAGVESDDFLSRGACLFITVFGVQEGCTTRT